MTRPAAQGTSKDASPKKSSRNPASQANVTSGEAAPEEKKPSGRSRKDGWDTYGNHEVPKIDYSREDGVPAMLQAYRYVAQYSRKGRGEDSVMSAARRLKKKRPQAFIDKLHALEQEWAAKKPQKPGEAAPLEMDARSQKCLEAIRSFLDRHHREALERGKVYLEGLENALRGEEAVRDSRNS